MPNTAISSLKRNDRRVLFLRYPDRARTQTPQAEPSRTEPVGTGGDLADAEVWFPRDLAGVSVTCNFADLPLAASGLRLGVLNGKAAVNVGRFLGKSPGGA